MAKRTSVTDIMARKSGPPIVCLTAYTHPIARLLDAEADLLLVGDSLGMVVYGFENTLGVTLDHMIAHGDAVVRATKSALIVVDMPFGSYEEGPELAFRNAARVLAETGASAVKLEGGEAMAPTIRFLTERGVPVMGHVGLLPQHVNSMGGFKTQGRDEGGADRILADAIAVADAGVFSIVIEGVVEPIAVRITQAVPVPTIGIGASSACDGQILVTDDIIGLNPEFKPSFVKRYANLGEAIVEAAQEYSKDVQARRFPGPEHVKDK